ncbi:MAG TPA: hypothetical protein VFG54_19810 [Prolixibacteraceae bacterium]|nr:hypothetical protein [Prolixibacteraceae bacterium]
MNQIKILFCFLLILVTLSQYTYGQENEKKNSLSVSATAAQYMGIHDFGRPAHEESYTFPISPGAEITYWRQISSSVKLGLGINYQKVHHQSQLDINIPGYGGVYKFPYEEISIPLLLRKSFQANNQNHWYITLGVYNGKQRNIKLQGWGSSGWGPRDYTQLGGYSDDHFFTDLYLDAGYALQLGNNGVISLAPFYKYRVNSTWVNTYLRKSIIGINLNYSFKF